VQTHGFIDLVIWCAATAVIAFVAGVAVMMLSDFFRKIREGWRQRR
jgi:hypothetical protein